MHICCYFLIITQHIILSYLFSACNFNQNRAYIKCINKKVIFAKMSDFKVLRAAEDDLNVTEFVDLFNQKVK